MSHDFPRYEPQPTMFGRPVYMGECSRCGITTGEDMRNDNPPCTGNAYICRVARKLMGYLHVIEPPVGFIKPWEYFPADLYVLVDSIVSYTGRRLNDTIDGLVRRVADRPDVCPILADALEDAGCQDAALLSALRTT